MELQGRLDRLKREGLALAAISYDPVPVLDAFSSRRGITFPLLSDPGSETITRYGILNTTIPPGNQQANGVPFPGTFLVNRKGVVTARYFEAAYQERDTVGSILVRLGRSLDVAGTQVSAPHLDVTTFATDAAVSPGTHFSLVLDVRPAPGVHVYAPGVSGYKPITLDLEPQPAVLIRGVQFPKAEDYYFKPLKEHVPVFQRPFRIVQDIATDASPEGQARLQGVSALTIKGTLTYQACTDKECFTPQSVPLTWSVELRELDRVRAR